ncbi:MAG: glycerophosphodiester phosphodiesterase family protein [Chlorobiales bacterium]|nr:glycerophosphodiester phosphodiesterase family protein [Chlorobiales bacterium]
MGFEIQAHRGARSFFPENTCQAFCKAADLGVRVLELDLVVSKDHEIVVSHDPWLSGPCCSDSHGHSLSYEDRLRYVMYDMAYVDIATFDCGLPHPSFSHQQRITACKPLLSTVFNTVDAYMILERMKGRMIYNLEIKSWPDKDGVFHPTPDRYAALVLRCVEEAGLSNCVRIQSFDSRVVREAWKRNPQLCYGLLIDEMKNMELCLQALDFLPQYVNPHVSLVNRELTEYLHAQHIKMIPWTVNNKVGMLAMKQGGADGIITDYPEIALELFGS